MNEELIAKVKKMIDEASDEIEYMATGFDEGYYCGKVKAFSEILELLETV